MDVFTIVGKVVGSTVKGVGSLANALLREATGIDVKKTVGDVATTNANLKKINNDDSLTSEEKESLKKAAFYGMQSDINGQFKDKADSNREKAMSYVADNLKNMSDQEIDDWLASPEVNAKTKAALSLEKEKRKASN